MPFKQGSTEGQSIRPKLKRFHLWPSIAAFKVQHHQFTQIYNNGFLKEAAVNHEAFSCHLGCIFAFFTSDQFEYFFDHMFSYG